MLKMEDLLIKTILPIIIAVIGWVIAVRQYYLNDSEKNLEKELERLRETFNAIVKKSILYKSLFIRYPLSVTNVYGLSFLRINKVQVVYNIDTSLSVYDNFYAYICNVSRYLGETELTLGQILTLYDIFVENLEQRDLIDQTFQVMYYSIQKAVAKKFLDKNKKIERLSKVQNSITSKQAIFYFFNQLRYADRQRKCNKFLEKLYDWGFFKKMFESQEYKNIQDMIPLTVEKMFYKQERL